MNRAAKVRTTAIFLLLLFSIVSVMSGLFTYVQIRFVFYIATILIPINLFYTLNEIGKSEHSKEEHRLKIITSVGIALSGLFLVYLIYRFIF